MRDVTSMSGLSINWYRHHRRSDEIGLALGVTPHYIRSEQSNLLIRYLAQARETRRILKVENPDFVVVMQPPAVALLVVATWAWPRRRVVVGDLHSGVFFDRKWRPLATVVLRILRRLGGAVVPNEDLATIARAGGVSTFVCHGLITAIPRRTVELDPPNGNTSYALVPLTYSYDEPIAAILGATELAPDVTWVLTGQAPDEVRLSGGPNVVFPGFVSRERYRDLHAGASVIVALTTEDSTMQSAAYEATASATPLVTSPFKVLRDYYGDAAIYVENTPESIATGVGDALTHQSDRNAAMSRLRDSVIASQDETSRQFRSWLELRISER